MDLTWEGEEDGWVGIAVKKIVTVNQSSRLRV